MLRNYILLALRNLQKNRLFSAINIFGLACAMSLGLFILLLWQDAKSYDRFHPGGDRIFRINTEALRKDGGSEPYASSPAPLGAALKSGFAPIEEMVRFSPRSFGEVKGNGKMLPVEAMMAEPAFLQTFGFQLLEGDASTALRDPFSIVLTEKCADRFFPRQTAVGQTLEVRGHGNFKITGVLAAPPGKTHLDFEALASFSSLEKLPEDASSLGDWNNYYSFYNYIRLQPGASVGQAEAALAAVAKSEFAGRVLESRDAGYRFYLQPLAEITPGPMLSNGLGRALPGVVLTFLAVLAAIVLLSACFNYTNLTLARALTRARELGVRKVMGATRVQLFGQLLGESVVTCLLALVMAYGLLKLVQPGFNSLSFTAFADVAVRENGLSMLLFLGFAVLTGLVAGAIPAATMSRISPVSVLRKLEGIRFFKRVGLRKFLLTVQFAVSLVFIVMVTVVSKQIRYMAGLDYGFRTEQILNINLQGQRPEKIVPALSALPGVEGISAASMAMGTYSDSSVDIKTAPEAEPTPVRDYSVDHHFLENLGLTLVAGDNFPENVDASQHGAFVLVNEKFLENFSLGSPAEAIGKQLTIGDSTRVNIRGVVRDFLFKPADYALEPLLLRNDPAAWQMLHLKISPAVGPTEVMVALERAWGEAVPGGKLQAEFYTETIRNNYANLRDVLAIISVFAFLGVLIAALGLLGMATYTVETRMKEVSLRKALGASPHDLVLLLSRNFVLLLAIAIAAAAPLGWFLGQGILSFFAQRIALGAGVLLPGILILLLVGGTTVGFQAVRAALANPVKSLRSE
jgi:putative ABC transport system permease protein